MKKWVLLAAALWYFQPLPITQPDGSTAFFNNTPMYSATTKAACEQRRQNYLDAHRDDYVKSVVNGVEKSLPDETMAGPCRRAHSQQ